MTVEKAKLVRVIQDMSMEDDSITEAQEAIATLQRVGVPIPKRLLDRVARANQLGGLVAVVGKIFKALGTELHVPNHGAVQVIYWVWKDGDGNYQVKPMLRSFGDKERLSDRLVRDAVSRGNDVCLQTFDVNPKRPAPKA